LYEDVELRGLQEKQNYFDGISWSFFNHLTAPYSTNPPASRFLQKLFFFKNSFSLKILFL